MIQIEEPIGVLEETTSNDVTDYTDWSTFDGEPYNVFIQIYQDALCYFRKNSLTNFIYGES